MGSGETAILSIVPAFVLAFLLGLGALRLKLSPLVGYLAAGILVGPFVPGITANRAVAAELAEVGVVLLMFGVGLHFSPEDLFKVRRVAIPGALLQMALGVGLAFALGPVLGLGPIEAALLGLCLSMASTVLVLRVFEGRGEMRSEAGHVATGWLVVQDMVVILGLAVLPPLLKGRADPQALALGAAWQVGKLAAFVALMLVVGGRAFPWLLVRVAHARSRELFTLGVLSIALGIAWLAYVVFGASFALGAFVAGLVLSGSKLGHNAAERALPFRDAFAVLFFVSVGMLFDPRTVFSAPVSLAAAIGVVFAAAIIAALVVLGFARAGRVQTLRLAAVLPQIGEFSFVLASLAVSLGVMSPRSQQLVIATAIATIVLNPLLEWAADRLTPPA